MAGPPKVLFCTQRKKQGILAQMVPMKIPKISWVKPKILINQPMFLKNNNHLPVVLLSNIQSFGKSDKTDKTAELELVLKLNKVQVGVFTETWLDDITCQHLNIDNYVMFHSIRNKALKASGGVLIFVMEDIPSTKINVAVPDHLEVIYVSIRPKWLPRSISNIVLCAVYYPGSSSKYAPPQEDLILHLNEKIHNFTAYMRIL